MDVFSPLTSPSSTPVNLSAPSSPQLDNVAPNQPAPQSRSRSRHKRSGKASKPPPGWDGDDGSGKAPQYHPQQGQVPQTQQQILRQQQQQQQQQAHMMSQHYPQQAQQQPRYVMRKGPQGYSNDGYNSYQQADPSGRAGYVGGMASGGYQGGYSSGSGYDHQVLAQHQLQQLQMQHQMRTRGAAAAGAYGVQMRTSSEGVFHGGMQRHSAGEDMLGGFDGVGSQQQYQATYARSMK